MPPLEVELEVGGQDAVLHHGDHLVVLLLGQVAQDLVVVQDHHTLVEVVLLKDRRRVQLRQRVLGLGLREKTSLLLSLLQPGVSHLTWNLLLVPLWSRSWHRQAITIAKTWV